MFGIKRKSVRTPIRDLNGWGKENESVDKNINSANKYKSPFLKKLKVDENNQPALNANV
jgi:hypothetical protein